MSEEDSVDNKIPAELEKELDMFKEYMNYVPFDTIAVKYSINIDTLYKISQRNHWRKRRNEAKEIAYKAIDKKFKKQIVDIVNFVQHDYALLMSKKFSDSTEMTKEERQYVLKLLEILVKEVRLDSGKPTEIHSNDGVIRHEIILPPGAKRFGIIPPPENVVQVEKSEIPIIETQEKDEENFDD